MPYGTGITSGARSRHQIFTVTKVASHGGIKPSLPQPWVICFECPGPVAPAVESISLGYVQDPES